MSVDRFICELKNLNSSYFKYKSFLRSIFDKSQIVEKRILSNITLKLKKNQILGIIGDNGSGKSTLLKVISGIIKITDGTIKLNKPVYSILENNCNLFDDISGYRNIIMKLRFMGFNKTQIKVLTEEILNFSEIKSRSLDPVRTYSDGMKARLIFSIMTIPCPNFFLIDEILSAGDEEFLNKCIRKIGELCKTDTSAILVSHDLFLIERFCDKIV